MKARTALASMAGIYIVQLLLVRLFDIYGMFSWFDIPMHFMGGFAAGMLGIAIHHNMTDKHHFASGTPAIYHTLFVAGFVALIAVAWEFHEYILDNTIGGNRQLSLGDTMLDLLLGVFGGTLASIVFKKDL